VAGRGPVWHLPATTVAGRGLAWPDAGGRWLPVWLPYFISAAKLRQNPSGGLKLAIAPGQSGPRGEGSRACPMSGHEASGGQRTRPTEDAPAQHQRRPSPWPVRWRVTASQWLAKRRLPESLVSQGSLRSCGCW
jgi:hypothetical protein